MSKNVATITFASATQLALFTNELCGQISDGHWENSGPRDHWIFWYRLDHAIGENVGVVTNKSYRAWDESGCRKNNYNFMSAELLDCVGDRMLKTARLAMCLDYTNMDAFKSAVYGADYMPDTLAEYEACLAGTPHKYDFANDYLKRIPAEAGRKFYTTEYTVKDLHKDLRAIKKICKTMPISR